MSQYDFRPGDVWVDTALRSDTHEDGVRWIARLDSAGQVELYEPNGPGLIPARDVVRIRGGMKLLSRDEPAVDPECEAKGCDIPDGYSECRRCGAEAVNMEDEN